MGDKNMYLSFKKCLHDYMLVCFLAYFKCISQS